MRISNYTFGSFEDIQELGEWVNVLIKKGWQPYGSPCMTLSSGQLLGDCIAYGQAMVIYE